VRDSRRNVHSRRALHHDFLAADDKLGLEAGKLRPFSDHDVIGVAIVRVLVHVFGLRRLDLRDRADDGVKVRLGFELPIDENVTDAGCCLLMVFYFGRRPDLRS